MSKILLIEDEENIRMFTKINLEREGFEVLEAGSGEEGVEVALKYNPQVVILDIIDGVQDIDPVLDEPVRGDLERVSLNVVPDEAAWVSAGSCRTFRDVEVHDQGVPLA